MKSTRKAIRRRAIVAALIGAIFVSAYVGVGFAVAREGRRANDVALNADPQYILVERDIYVGAMAKWDISDEEEKQIATVVMSVARGELPVVQQAVAQCLRTSCEELGITVAEAIATYHWPTYCEIPAEESVYDAIEKVVNGYPAIDTEVFFCYNPSIQKGEWHETQVFVAEIGNLRFFTLSKLKP